jgi:hypothetical protein
VAVPVREDRVLRALTVAVLVLSVIVVGLSCLRIFYGADLTDEAFYAAVPYRFTQGDAPFVDENNIGQTSGIVTAPLVYLWVSLVGSTAGLILFLRVAYLLLQAVAGLTAYLLLRRDAPRDVALLAALAAVSMAPFRLPTLSYNTLSMALMAAGLAVLLLAHRASRPALAVAAGIAHVVACFAYPPLAVALIAGVLFIVCSQQRRALPWVKWYSAGIAITGIPLAALLLMLEPSAIVESLRVTRTMGAQLGGITKPVRVVWRLLQSISLRPLLPAAVVAAVLIRQRRPVLAATLLALTPLLGVLPSLEPVSWSTMSLVYVASYSLVCLWPVLVLSDDVARASHVRTLALITASAGLVFGYASSNGYLVSGLAYPLLFATVLAGVSLLVDALLREGGVSASRARVVAVLPPALALIILVGIQFTGTYRDAPLAQLTSRVESGPYSGIRTTPERSRMLTELTALVEERVPSDGSVFFFPKFPAGYILSSRRALTNFVWAPSIGQHPAFDFDSTFKYFDRRSALPDLVVFVPRAPGDTPDVEPYASFFVRKGYEPVALTTGYRAWVRPGLTR